MVLALPSPPSPVPVGQQLWPLYPQLILVLLATSAKEEFGTPLIFDDFSLNASENFSKQISKTMSAAEHFSSWYNCRFVPALAKKKFCGHSQTP
jgi:hypothetical protein